MEKTTILHPFESRGLGLAPFRFLGCEDMGKVCRGCGYCGTGLRIVCHIKSADGKRFIVGTDCVAKTLTKTDTTLALDVRKAIDAMKREKAEARRLREWERLKARMDKARSSLAEDVDLFSAEPHPHPYHAKNGLTKRDYFDWILRHGGNAARVDVCRAIETATANHTPAITVEAQS